MAESDVIQTTDEPLFKKEDFGLLGYKLLPLQPHNHAMCE